jgi:putative phage-type endonuclease
MKTHTLTQGSPEWLAHRRNFFNASDAPAMMGCSPYKTRSQLLYELHTGLTADVDAGTQRRFDDGHRFEALARPLAEEIIGEELYPIVGTSGNLSASFDGLTLMYDVAFEHKTLNDSLRYTPWDEGNGEHLPLHFRVQMEQQIYVSGAERCLFMATKWAGDECTEHRHCWYVSDADLRAQILAGWEQFAADLAAYEPAEAAAEVVAAPVESLPAVSVRMEGSIAVISNLSLFGDKLRAFVEKIDRNPSTDQAFADAEAAIKTLQTAQDALEQAEASALAQTSSIEEMRRTVADYANLARTTRLALKKIVDARKEQIKTEIVTEGREAMAAHIAALNARLGKLYMPAIPADFAGAIKGKKTVFSLRDAMGTELARAKIEASAIADKINTNLKTLCELASEHAFLFADTAAIVQKAPDDLTMLVKSRIAEHQAAEAKRLEFERERIRAEEAARLEREQQAAANNAALIERGRELVNDIIAAECIAAAAPAVRTIHPAAAVLRNEAPTLKLGEINARLGLTVSAAFLAELGFEALMDKRACLYRESEWMEICDAISEHVLSRRELAMAA